MYTEAVVSRVNSGAGPGRNSGLAVAGTKTYTPSHVREESRRNHTSAPPRGDGTDLCKYIELLNSRIVSKLRLLLTNASYKPLVRDAQLVDLESLKEVLKRAGIEKSDKAVLELCLLVSIFLSDREEGARNLAVSELCADGKHKFDLSAELVNKIANSGCLSRCSSAVVLELLVNLCIWTLETAHAQNLVHLAFELLCQALSLGFQSELVLSYIGNAILGTARIVAHTSYTEAHSQQIYWKLRILQLALSRGILEKGDIVRVREFALNALKLRNKSIYIQEECVCLLAQIWQLERAEFELDLEVQLRILAKLLSAGDHSFLPNFSLGSLVRCAIRGPVQERKLALKCLALLPEGVEDRVVFRSIEALLYKRNFTRYRGMLGQIDLGILAVGVCYLKDFNTALSYLGRLHNILGNIIGGPEVPNEGEFRPSSGFLKALGCFPSPPLYHPAPGLTIYKIFTQVVQSYIGGSRISRDRVKSLQGNLKLYYYQIFDLVNAIIATRSCMYLMNSMAIKVHCVTDLLLYLILGLDRNFTSVRKDYVEALTLTTNHVDFRVISSLLEIIGKLSDKGAAGPLFKPMLAGLCSYFEILYEFNLKDIYGTNHPRIFELTDEILLALAGLLTSGYLRSDLGLLAHVLKVLKVLYGYNPAVLRRIVAILVRIVESTRPYLAYSRGSSGPYKEAIEGSREEFLLSFARLYEFLSQEKLPFVIHQYSIVALTNPRCAAPVSRGLYNAVVTHPEKQLLRTVAYQLSLLQVQDLDPSAISGLTRLSRLVALKMDRLQCTLFGHGPSYAFKFRSLKLRITRDSVGRRISELLKFHLVHIRQLEELRLFESDYTLAPDVLEPGSHDCPGE